MFSYKTASVLDPIPEGFEINDLMKILELAWSIAGDFYPGIEHHYEVSFGVGSCPGQTVFDDEVWGHEIKIVMIPSIYKVKVYISSTTDSVIQYSFNLNMPNKTAEERYKEIANRQIKKRQTKVKIRPVNMVLYLQPQPPRTPGHSINWEEIDKIMEEARARSRNKATSELELVDNGEADQADDDLEPLPARPPTPGEWMDEKENQAPHN